MVVEVKEALIVVMVLLHLMVVVIGVMRYMCSACFNALALELRPLHLESYLTARSGHSKCSKDIGPTYFQQMEI